jgi:hypothetical protein
MSKQLSRNTTQKVKTIERERLKTCTRKEKEKSGEIEKN